MAKIITSPNVTFMDTTDNRKLDVYITSNLPTVQIKNSNTNPVAYTPNWASTPLVLEADAYLDSQDVNNKTTFSWYKKNALGVETPINANAKTITIKNNALDDGQLVVYVCKALYRASDADNGVEDFEQITFTQVTAGINGQDGTSVTILGSYDTLSALQSAHPTGNAGDAYLVGGRLYVWAVDNREWEDVGNIQGPKGDSGVGIRSVTITYGVSDTSSTQPTSWQTNIPTTAEGKYLWTRTVIDYTDDSIPDTVTYIYAKQGSKGDTGTAGSSVTVSSVQYQEGTSATVAPTGTWSNAVVTAAEGKYLWTKTTFSDGKTAYGVAKQGVSGKDGVGINSTTVDYGVSDSATVRPTSWQQDIPVVAEGQYLWTRTVIDYTDASKADTVTYTYAKQGAKGDTGVAGSSVTVSSIQYQEGASATTAPTGTWSPVVVAVADGKYLWTKTVFSDGKIAYGVAKQGQKGDKGDQGIQGIQGPKGEQGIQGPKGVDGQTSYFHIKYSANANGNPMSETPSTYIGTYVDYTADDSTDYTKYTWSRFIGSQGAKGDQGIAGTNGTDGKTSYLHIAYATSATGSSGFSVSDSVNKTYIGQYTDYTEADSTDYTKYKWTLIKGEKGDQGVQGPKGNDGQQLYTWIKYADTPTSGMSNDPAGKTYIGLAYNKTTATESNTYSDYMWSLIKGETGPTGPKGDDGQQYYTWIKYADNASGANMSDSPTGKLYIGLAYNKTTSTESSVASDYTWALFKGDKGDTGDKGADAYTVLLTNESHVFTGNVSSAVASSATTQVLAYKGTTAQSVTIVSINGVAAKTASTATGIAGLTFACSALSGTSPTITFTCTTSFVSPNGSIPIVLSVGGVTITKMFAYSIAFKGTTGTPGSPGTPASLVDVTPSAHYFKSTTGKDGTFTPDYIYLYPRFQTVTYNKWEYSTNGGTSWTAVTSGSNGLTIGTYNSVANSLQIAATSALYTDSITSISFRCVSSNASVYDTVSIAKIYDVVDLQIGGRNLLRWTQGLPITTTRNGPDGISLYSTTIGDLSATDEGLKLTFASNSSTSMSIPLATDGCIENGEMYTLSFDYRGNITYPGSVFFLQRTTPNESIDLASISTLVANETEWQHYEATFSSNSINNRINYQMLLFYGLQSYTSDNWIEVKKESLKLEKGNKKTAWTPAIEDVVGTPGAAGADAVTFQVYSSTGYALSTNTPTATLQTFAYIGDIAISAGATYQWYEYSTNNWVAISGATNPYLTVGREDVAFSKNYKCIMTFNGTQYVGIATLDDKNDTNKVFTTKPSNYAVGDLWIVGVDYAPYGVEVGTLLRAEHTNITYDNADWITATKYDEKIKNIQSDINTYNQYFSLKTDGLKISARDTNGIESPFSTVLTNEQLSFNYGDESIAYINGTKMNIKEAEIESPLTVTGKYSGSTMLQAPVINIGNFSIIVESNGSLSIVTNT